MPVTRRLLTLALIPLLLFLVACGGDDDDDGDAGGDQPSASDSGGSGDSDSSDGDGDSDANVDDAEAILENCPELISMFGAFSAGGFAGGSSNTDIDFEEAVEVFQNAAANAPDEIKADMEVLAEAFATFYTTLEDVGVDLADPASFAALDASQQAELQTALESLSGPELEEASANLDAYFTENCS